MPNVTNIKTIEINGVTYVEECSAKQTETLKDFSIVRTRSAGVFAGNLVKRDGLEGTVENAIRIWYWKGAASLSQLAMEGVKSPEECKFAMQVTSVDLTEIIEVIPCTSVAMKNIIGVPSWKQ